MRIKYRMNPICCVRLHKKNGCICSEPLLHGGHACKKHYSLAKESIPFLSSYILRSKGSSLSLSATSSLSFELMKPLLYELKNRDKLTVDIVTNILTYIYTLDVLKKYMELNQFHRIKPKKTKITEITSFIANLFIKMIKVESSIKYLKSIRKLQYDWRKYYKDKSLKDQGPWPALQAINEEDPITLEPLNDLNKEEVWSYKDSQGHVYAFLARTLQHFIETNGPWNPYTREPFTKEDLERLNRMTQRLPPVAFTVVWRNAHDAFADVLYSYERYGFYTCIDWFLQLTPNDIIHIYQHMREDPYVPAYMFTYQLLEERLLENPEDGAHMAFAKDMKYLMESNHSMKFYIVCNIFVALAQVCPTLRNTLPQWTIMGAVGVQR